MTTLITEGTETVDMKQLLHSQDKNFFFPILV